MSSPTDCIHSDTLSSSFSNSLYAWLISKILNLTNSSFPNELQAKKPMLKMLSAAGKQNGHFSKFEVELFENCILWAMDKFVKDVTLVEVYSEPKITYWNQICELKTSKNPFCKTFALILNRIFIIFSP